MHGVTQTSIGCYGNTLTCARVETDCWYLGIKRRGHNVLMEGELGPTWLSAGLKPVEHQGTIITPLTHTHSALGHVFRTYGEWGHGSHLCSKCDNPVGAQIPPSPTHPTTLTHARTRKTPNPTFETLPHHC